jgi:hypothetical protein
MKGERAAPQPRAGPHGQLLPAKRIVIHEVTVSPVCVTVMHSQYLTLRK